MPSCELLWCSIQHILQNSRKQLMPEISHPFYVSNRFYEQSAVFVYDVPSFKNTRKALHYLIFEWPYFFLDLFSSIKAIDSFMPHRSLQWTILLLITIFFYATTLLNERRDCCQQPKEVQKRWILRLSKTESSTKILTISTYKA